MHLSGTLILLLALATCVYADTATQTDWSGGPGIMGPVLIWDDVFYDCAGVSWSSIIGQISLLPGNFENIIDSSFDEAFSVMVDDIDADGDSDVLCGGEILSWWDNVDGTGTVWTEYEITGPGSSRYTINTGDIDCDSDADVLTSEYDLIAWHENSDGQGTAWTGHTISINLGRPVKPFSGDYDGDGDIDVLCADWQVSDSNIYWWENQDGLGTSWVEHQIATTCFGGYSGVYSDDIDGDGDCDFVGAASYDCSVIWLENADGQGTSWIEITIDDDFDSSSHVRTDDFDGDGDIDVLGAGNGADAVSWWENLDGSGSSWTKHVAASYSAHCGIHSDDLDRDGDSDILVSVGLDGLFVWLENVNGLGLIWQEHIICDLGSYNWASSISSGDVNGDGWRDVLGASHDNHFVRWWDIHSNEALLESSILDMSCDPSWGNLSWTSVLPSETAVAFQVRSSDNFAQMGAWSDTLDAPCSLAGILTEGDSYLQYRAFLTTIDPDSTPTLLDVTVAWDPLGIEDDPPVTEYLLFGVAPNPTRDVVTIRYAVPETASVELAIIELTGRVVLRIEQSGVLQGIHDEQLRDLSPGIYFCRMTSSGFTAIQKFVVID